MAKPEWGQKRACTSCGCRFYDMQRTPVTCPKCGAAVETEAPFKTRRGGGAAAAAAAAAVVAASDIDAVAEEEEEAASSDTDDEEEEEEADLIEDTSDLGGDDDDMAEVMEHVEGGLEDEP